MGIMKLSNVPELNEFAGTEKIYVNDNGETKQIACDKVVTAGGGGVSGRIILNVDDTWNIEEVITMMENGDDVWVVDGHRFAKIISYDWATQCGGYYFVIIYAYASGGTASLKRHIVDMISGDVLDRVNNFVQ